MSKNGMNIILKGKYFQYDKDNDQIIMALKAKVKDPYNNEKASYETKLVMDLPMDLIRKKIQDEDNEQIPDLAPDTIDDKKSDNSDENKSSITIDKYDKNTNILYISVPMDISKDGRFFPKAVEDQIFILKSIKKNIKIAAKLMDESWDDYADAETDTESKSGEDSK